MPNPNQYALNAERFRPNETRKFGWIIKKQQDNPVHLRPVKNPSWRNLKKKMWLNVCSIKEPLTLNKVMEFIREKYRNYPGTYSAQMNKYDFEKKRQYFQSPVIFSVSQNKR